MFCLVRNKLDQRFRTDGYTFAAGDTFLFIDESNAVHDVDSVKVTNFHTASESGTAVLAGLRTASRHTDGGHTVLVAEIFIFGGSLLTGSRTFDESDHLFHISGLHAHDLAYLCRHSRSSHRAGGNRCFSLCDSLCQSIAAGKSTAAAVVARQTFS